MLLGFVSFVSILSILSIVSFVSFVSFLLMNLVESEPYPSTGTQERNTGDE